MRRLTMRQSQAVTAMAQVLSSFLPGSGNRNWKGHVSFHSIAVTRGLAEYWIGGTKIPAIANLLHRTLQERRDQFEGLLLDVVRCGIMYRQKKNEPITRQELLRLNGLLLEVEFKFEELWELAAAPDISERSGAKLERAMRDAGLSSTTLSQQEKTLQKLKEEFLTFYEEPDRNKAGYKLERILNELLRAVGIVARKPFKVVGEQIDGSFELDAEIYLLEAKWEKNKLGHAHLAVFREKVTGKSAYTRGVFVAMNGVTEDAKDAIIRGKQPNFFIIDGHDLMMVLSGEIDLKAFLRQRFRLLAEEGAIAVPFKDFWAGSRGTVA